MLSNRAFYTDQDTEDMYRRSRVYKRIITALIVCLVVSGTVTGPERLYAARSGDPYTVAISGDSITDRTENDIFSVVIDVRDTSGNNNASLYTDYSYQNSDWISFHSEVSPKQSYFFDQDVAAAGYCLRIKAFTDNAGSGPDKPEKKTAALAQYADGDHT